MNNIRKKALAGLKSGDTFEVTRTFTEEQTAVFADISRDYNPVHFDKRFAAAKNLNGRICHGLLVAGMVTEIGGQLGWLATRMDFRFKKPVYFGDTIRCRLTVISIDKKGGAYAEAVFTNQNEKVVLESGLTGIIPADEEKKVMQKMAVAGN